MIYVALYLMAVVAANISVTLFGPQFAILNSFIFIGFDFFARDALHERWQGRQLWSKMLLLIGTGGLLSVIVNADALPIAIASCAAFVSAGIVDALLYQGLLGYRPIVKANGSNLLSALVDSAIFVVLAFGSPILWTVIAQAYLAKLAGGVFWSLLLFGAWSKTARHHATSGISGD